MSKNTGLLRRAAAVAAFSGVALALTTGTATAAPATAEVPTAASVSSANISPSTQKAWDDFIAGGAIAAGGASQMISGAWVGAPGLILAGATGSPLTPEQMQAWQNWDEGGHKVGLGVAMVVAGVYVGAPGYIIDQIEGGASPADLSPAELEKVSFLIPKDSSVLDGVPTDQIPNPMSPLSL